jgi:hypothetical protein
MALRIALIALHKSSPVPIVMNIPIIGISTIARTPAPSSFGSPEVALPKPMQAERKAMRIRLTPP